MSSGVGDLPFFALSSSRVGVSVKSVLAFVSGSRTPSLFGSASYFGAGSSTGFGDTFPFFTAFPWDVKRGALFETSFAYLVSLGPWDSAVANSGA